MDRDNKGCSEQETNLIWHSTEACACRSMACAHIAGAHRLWDAPAAPRRAAATDRPDQLQGRGHAVGHRKECRGPAACDRCSCGDAQTIRLMQRKHVEEYEFGLPFARAVITFVRAFLLTLALTNQLVLFKENCVASMCKGQRGKLGGTHAKGTRPFVPRLVRSHPLSAPLHSCRG